MPQISIFLPDDIAAEFTRIVEEKSINRSKLVTKLVTEWIEKQKSDKKPE